jgi:hypothetical protein
MERALSIFNNIKEKDDTIYNVINNENKTVVFNYMVLFVALLFVFKNYIHVNPSVIVAIILFMLVVYYFNTYRTIHNLETTALEQDKFNAINPTSDVLRPYNEINDAMFYFLDFKNINIQKYNQLTKFLENFIILYETANLEPKTISYNYQKMKDLKIQIAELIDSYNLCTIDNTYVDIIYKTKLSFENILSGYMNNVMEMQKQYVKKYGYNLNTKLISKMDDAVLPINYDEFL